MDRFEDRTPLWDYSDNSSPDTGASPRGYNRSRAEDASRAYVAIEEDGREQRRPRRPYREQGYRRDNWEDERAGDYRRPVRSIERSDWPRYERTSRREDYYDAAAEARGERRPGGGGYWPSEFGYPPSGGYSPYGNYPQSRRPDYDPDERGFLDRAGDELLSWFGDRDARRRRELDHRGRGPKGYIRSDERIREDVNDRLTEDVWIDASEIEVSVADGEVTLAGTVEDRRSKRRAEDLADDVTGVKHVQNNLRYSTGVVSPKLS
ncbi:BON domain-containing protein [Sphingopyxis sp. PAMC25046]|nr:BON domain-containing protein [Sphingopyxis sp. PAMC25046]